MSELIVLIWSFAICLSFRYKGFVFNTQNSTWKYLNRRFNQTSLLYVPLFFVEIEMIFTYKFSVQYIILAVGIPLLYWLIDYKRLRLLMMDFSYEPGEVPTHIYVVNFINLILLIIGEEIFFRYTIYHVFLNRGPWIVAVTSTVLFVLSHLIANPKLYGKIEILKQILFSLLCCYLVLKTHSIIYAILAHFTYNLPYIFVLIRRAILNRTKD